ncbi:MAG TPA: hypothetical protein VM511_13280 [Luteolibacter sp.]|nr:hypothetical protein [Luteolibacter sp.]
MKTYRFLPFLLAGFAHGQVYTPPAAPGPAPAPAPAEAETTPAAPGKKKEGGLSGQDFPMLDPSFTTITVGGVAIPLGDNALIKARFEKYLNQPSESDVAAEEYRKTIAEILATISPFHAGGPDLYSAFKKLPTAATFPGDANICSSLAESIYMSMLSKQDVSGLAKLNKTIEEEKKAIIRESDWAARNDRDSSLGNGRQIGGGGGNRNNNNNNGNGNNNNGNNNQNNNNNNNNGGNQNQVNNPNGPAKSPGAGINSLKYQDALRRMEEIEALRRENILRTELQTVRTKAQYQVNMVQWFMQRRYEHVLMAARFYNQIWKDGDTELRIDSNSNVSKLFSESMGVSPTVSSLDSLSNEAIRETQKYIETFDLLLSRDELHAASQRLMEAYALGEFLTPLATLPLEKKRRVADYVRDLHELYGTLVARDYSKTQILADRLKANAKDFPSSKVDSAIAAYTLASDLAIEEAKAHVLARNSDKAAEKIKAATEIWPTNPKLKEFSSLVNNSGGLNVARNDFDRLLSEANYREIARRQYEIAPAIQGDATREDAFKQIMTNLGKIETALGKANEFSKVGQNYAAWEQLAELREQFPDDPKLGRELELLAPKVADFTKALDEAKKHESRTPKQTGSALAWYLKASDIYPDSKVAEAGVQRVLDDVLVDDGK